MGGGGFFMLKKIYYRGKNYTVSFDSYLNTVNIMSTNISTGRQFRRFMAVSIVRTKKQTYNYNKTIIKKYRTK